MAILQINSAGMRKNNIAVIKLSGDQVQASLENWGKAQKEYFEKISARIEHL
jgi:hypothetical protein